MARVIVVGAGPAGLAATEALLDGGDGSLEVELLSLEPYLGGNAAAFTTPDGRVVEQGLHCWFGFYEQMRGLLARSGVDIMKVSTSGFGEALVYEERDGGTHSLYLGPNTGRTLVQGLAYTGMTLEEKLRFVLFFARAMPEVLAGSAERFDDICFTAWCIERGFPPSLATTRMWRVTREAQFNLPGQVSAYPMIKTVKVMGRDFTTADFRFPMGAMSEVWWGPVADRIRSLGGRIRTRQQLVGLEHDGQRLRGLRFREVREAPVMDWLEHPVPTVPGSEHTVRDFDAAVLAIPPAAWQAILEGQPDLLELRPFANIARLSTVSPLGLHVWHREAVRWGPRSFVIGLDEPLGAVVDVKPFLPIYRNDARFGAVLHFVGPETGYEDWPEEDLLARSLASLRRVRGYEGFTMEGVCAYKLIRHHGPHRRYWNSEPGSLKYKPQAEGPLEGLWFAGDWVRNDLDFPCMESAIRGGRQAARGLLRSQGWGRRLARRGA
jgi:hypothetical protein